MYTYKKGNTAIIVLIVVVLIIAILLIVRNNKNKTAEVTPDTTSDTALEATLGTEDLSEGSVNATAGTNVASLSYTQALATYASKRIQITPSCQATPNNVTYKNGTMIMIDNRSAAAHTIKLGSTYPIKAWGFKIIKVSSGAVPNKLYMDCDTSQNVATVLVQ